MKAIVAQPSIAVRVLVDNGLASSFLRLRCTENKVDRLKAYSTVDPALTHIVGMQHHPAPDHGQVIRWCFCGRCRPMTVSKARVCCRTSTGLCILDSDPELCEIMLNTRSVVTAINSQRMLLNSSNWDYSNPNMRHAAYKQYIYATLGRIGKGVRVPVPSCVCWQIRDRWPSVDGYVGFRETPVYGSAASAQQKRPPQPPKSGSDSESDQ